MNGDFADFVLHLGDVAGGQDGAGLAVEPALEKAARHVLLGLGIGVADGQPDHEAVELGLGEGVGARHFGGVLGADDHEGLGDGDGLAVDRHPMLLHDLEEGGLGPGGGAVELVGENDAVDDGARDDLECAVRRIVDRETGDVGRGRVRRALNSCKGEREGVCQCFGQGGLADAGDVLEEEMAAGQKGGDDGGDQVGFADDALLHILFKSFYLFVHGGSPFDGARGGLLLLVL